MATFVVSMNQSLDGYVDHTALEPGQELFRHFVEQAQAQTGSIYGRVMYGLMRYWDEDDPDWGTDEHAFAAAWRRQPKWVVSGSLDSVGPNATLIGDGLEEALRDIKTRYDGEIEVAGPNLASSVAALGLVDEYQLYVHPEVIGGGTPFFAGPLPRLRLVAHESITADVVRLRYATT